MVDLSHHQDHPGVVAIGCPLRIIVTARRTDGGRGGYACSYTGGHCLPGDQCASRRSALSKETGE